MTTHPKIMRFAPVLLATCLWTTGNALLSYVPVRAQEIAQNDPNNPVCVSRNRSSDATNCALLYKSQPLGPCNPVGYCKKIHWKDWYCSPADTGQQITVPGFLGIGTQVVTVGGNCHTYQTIKTVPIYEGPCSQTHDPTSPGCSCPDSVLGNAIGTTTVSSPYCVNGTTSYALRLPFTNNQPKNIRVVSVSISTRKVAHP